MLTGRLTDSGLAGLVVALDPASMSIRLGRQVTTVEVLRHKPARRCVVRYDTADGPLIGKLRAGHRAASPYRLMERFRSAGFDDSAADGITVAAPVAAFDDLEMWVQRCAPGVPADRLLDQAHTATLVATSAARAAFKIHAADVATRRHHYITDELRILEAALGQAAARRPALAERIDALLGRCRRRAADADDLLDRGGPRGVHRDFYADQLVLDGDRVTVIDFDLYCAADPALDHGNFIAHLTEHALRVHRDPLALAAAEQACLETAIGLEGEQHRKAIEVYAELTLARHVALSTTVAGRSHTTPDLLAWCEQRAAAIGR